MARWAIYLLPWILLAWIEAPALVPEGMAERGQGPAIALAVRTGVLVAYAIFVFKRRGSRGLAPFHSLAMSLLTLIGGAAAFFAYGLLAKTSFEGCPLGPLQRAAICHRWVMGFSPDIPYFNLAKGALDREACATWTHTATITVMKQQRTFTSAPCPAAITGRCFTAEWSTRNGSHYFAAVAAGEDCKQGVFFDGRGAPARSRWERVRGLAP